MTSLTREDIGQDLSLLKDSITNNELLLASPFAAIKLSSILPLFYMGIYGMAIYWRWCFYVPMDDAFGDTISFSNFMSSEIGFSAFGFVFTIAIAASLYGPALLYLSIPRHVREKSVVLKKMKSLIKRMAIIAVFINVVVAVIGATWIVEALSVAPFVMMLSFFVMQWIVSAELTRYGISPVMKKLSALVKKI
ncbi:hypothetical protein [Erwinia aphidicola]|uniref:hypothetical protein n=1 Tax=Erwinia aphidicola TaxID=68334 RepID=UPI003015FC4C